MVRRASAASIIFWNRFCRAQQLLLLFSVFVLLTVMVIFVASAEFLRERALVAGARALEQQSAVVARSLSVELLATEQVVESIAGRYALLLFSGSAAMGQSHQILRELADRAAGSVRYVGIIDADGVLVQTSSTVGQTGINLKDLPFFSNLKNGAAERSLMSGMVISRNSGLPSIYLARPIIGPRGEFLGIVSADLDPGLWAHDLQGLQALRGAVGCITNDLGQVLVCNPTEIEVSPAKPASRLGVHDEMETLPGSGRVGTVTQHVTPRAFVSEIHLGRFPLTVRAEYGRAQILRDWRNSVIQIGLWLALWIATSAWLVLRMFRIIDENRGKSDELRSALREIRLAQQAGQIGIWTCDRQRGRVSMPRLVEQTSLAEDDAKIDYTYQDLLSRVHPDDLPLAEKTLRQLDGLRLAEGIEVRLNHAGDWTWFRFQGCVRDTDLAGRSLLHGVVMNVQKRKRAELAHSEVLRTLLHVQEAERMRIAHDLHDELGQAQLLLMLELDRIHAANSDAARQRHLVAAREQAARFAASLNQAVHQLRLSSLDDVGLIPALRGLCERWQEMTGIQVNFAEASGGRQEIPIEAATAAYRIVQEALTNIARHARATLVTLIANNRAGEVHLCIEDDGCGFDLDAEAPAAPRFGIVSMRERAAAFGGAIDIETRPGSGTSIYVRIPRQSKVE